MTQRRYIKPPNFIVTTREGAPLVYTTGVFGGLAPNDGRIIYFADRLEIEPGEVPGTQKVKAINQEVQAEIHMSPVTFKSIALWMMKNLENYEKSFGEIKTELMKKPGQSGDYVK